MEIDNPGLSVGTEPESEVASVQVGVQSLNIRPRRRERRSAESWARRRLRYQRYLERIGCQGPQNTSNFRTSRIFHGESRLCFFFLL